MSCNIGIIGRLAKNADLMEGQTVKTRVLESELELNINDCKIYYADTYNYKKRVFTVFFQTLRCFFKCKNIFLLLSSNGMKFYFPLVYYMNKIFKRNIIHDVIGGTLHNLVEENPNWVKYLNYFRINLVEVEPMKKGLEKLGVKNVEVVPNFKRLEVSQKKDLKKIIKLPISFCTFSRVAREKGILTAIGAIKELNKKYENTVATLDIYGKLEDDFKHEFLMLEKDFPNYINYKGLVPFNQSSNVLKKYDALLFPTYHPGEGFPGTIVDAYSVGLPVIATNWRHNPYLIDDKVTGFLYDYNNNDELLGILENIIGNSEIINNMRENCLRKYEEYSPEKAMKKIISYMEL